MIIRWSVKLSVEQGVVDFMSAKIEEMVDYLRKPMQI